MSVKDELISRIKTHLWRVFNGFQGSSLISSAIRCALLRVAGCSIAPEVAIVENVYIGSSNIYIEDHVTVNVGCFLDACARIELHAYVRLGPYVRILTGTHDYEHNVIRRDPWAPVIRKPVVIERGCWLGMGVMVLPGVRIREGCVVGAGAMVVRDTEPNGLYVGNPARRVKDLPTE